jgi:hypothetical protein
MDPLPVSKADQINAMLNGTLFHLLGRYVDDPLRTDFRKLITVERADIVAYLREHPQAAETYFQWQLINSPNHDVETILRRKNGYVVVTMFHGEERFPRQFSSIAEAVAEHVLLNFGMY